MLNLRYLWTLFEWASGLKINEGKSELFYLGKEDGKGSRLANTLGCPLGNFPTKYLGLPLSPRPPPKEAWWEIIHKLQRKIGGWQAKLLSSGGRLTLVNAVLTNLPLYFLSVFKAPAWAIKRVEALRRDFFWSGGRNLPGKGCLVAWKNACKAKEEGGLGILEVATMNQALLTKWWWKFHTTPALQWNKLIREIYYRRRKPLREGRSFRPYSNWWKGVLSLSTIFKWGVEYKLGDGRSIDFWLDRWCGGITLNHSFPDAYLLSQEQSVKVSDCFTGECWNWNRIMGVEVANSQGQASTRTELEERIAGSSIDHSPDVIQWRWSPDGLFSVKSTYVALMDGGLRDARASTIWSLRVPLKVKVFSWLVLKKRILTRDALLKRGWIDDATCMLCGSDSETVDHLFTRCVLSKYIIVSGVDDVAVQDLGEGVLLGWDRWRTRRDFQKGRSRLTDLVGCWWIIWKVRNDTIFRNITPNPSLAVNKLKVVLNEWDSILNPGAH